MIYKIDSSELFAWRIHIFQHMHPNITNVMRERKPRLVDIVFTISTFDFSNN